MFERSNMNIPKIVLSNDEKRWIEKVIEYYDINKTPNDVKIILDNQELFSVDFKCTDINDKLYTSSPLCINLYGIYCFDPANHFLKQAHRICKYIKQDLISNKNYCRTIPASELHEKLDIPEPQVRVCLALICDFEKRMAGATYEAVYGGGEIKFGFASMAVSALDDIRRFQKYKTIESFIKEMLEDQKPIAGNIENGNKRKVFSQLLLKSEIADKLDINPTLLSRKGSPWRILFDKYSKDKKRSRIPLDELLQQVKETYLRQDRTDYPKCIKELKGRLE